MKPLCIDLYAGLGGWTDGFLAEGWDCIGFDIERHVYGAQKYPAQLVLQDVLTLTGAQFRNAACIVASPPCQCYSYMAMPWTRAKKMAAEYRDGTRSIAELNALFDACFRIQREACEATKICAECNGTGRIPQMLDSMTRSANKKACPKCYGSGRVAGRHIPLVVENVKGAQPWVGRARGKFGSFYLWGDVPALMPGTKHAKIGGPRGDDWFAKRNTPAELDAIKNSGGSWFGIGSPGQKETGRNPVTGGGVKQHGSGAAWFDKALDERRKEATAIKNGTKVSGDWFGTYAEMKAAGTISPTRVTGKGTSARKAASAQIAKIPEALSRHIARSFRP